MFGDAFPSHDSDQLPGAQTWTTAPTQINPTTNDTGITMATLLTNSGMDTLDPITSMVIGEVNGGAANSNVPLKAATTFLNIRGLCPEEPNKYGSYYLPMLAHYAKTTDLRGAIGKRYGQHGQAKHHHLCCRGKRPGADLGIHGGRQQGATLVGLSQRVPGSCRQCAS